MARNITSVSVLFHPWIVSSVGAGTEAVFFPPHKETGIVRKDFVEKAGLGVNPEGRQRQF